MMNVEKREKSFQGQCLFSFVSLLVCSVASIPDFGHSDSCAVLSCDVLTTYDVEQLTCVCLPSVYLLW